MESPDDKHNPVTASLESMLVGVVFSGKYRFVREDLPPTFDVLMSQLGQAWQHVKAARLMPGLSLQVSQS